MRDCPNVYAETSNLVGADFLRYAARELGAHRLLFGSFLPVNDPWAAVGMILDAELPPEQKRLVAGGNLRRLLAEARE
jgi:predicted TIM-barrel fold metal-dependent hydrolase